MATTSIGAPGVTFPDGSVQATKGASGDVIMNVYTSSGTWTKPATVKSIKVTVVGGGGNGGPATRGPAIPAPGLSGGFSRSGSIAGSGGGGGFSVKTYPAASLPGPQPYTVGGAASTSSFGGTTPVVSATGGASAPASTGPTNGASGAGGSGSGGDLNIVGGPGATLAGFGGQSALGGQPGENISPNTAGSNGALYGGGGVGGIVASALAPSPSPIALTLSGGTGGQGVVIVEEFY